MRLLLDTCTFLWIVGGSEELSIKARRAFEDPANEVVLSAVSAWEIAVKHRLGRLPLPSRPESFVPAQRAAHGETRPISASLEDDDVAGEIEVDVIVLRIAPSGAGITD